MNQKLSDWASIAEIVSGIAVVVTLIFLVVELKGNTRATLAANRQSVAGRVESILLAPATSPELAAVLDKAEHEVPLDTMEVRVYQGYLAARLRNAEEAFLQFQDNQLSERYFLTRANSLRSSLQPTQAQSLWAQWRERENFTPEFTEWLDQALIERDDLEIE